MPQENLIVLAQVNEAFNEVGWDALFPFVDPDFEFHEPPEQPGATVFRGREAARKGVARWAEGWTEQRSEVQGVRELPDGRILAFTRERMRGRDGIEVEQDCGHLVTFRRGKILRWQSFWDPANALEAAGLSE